MNYINLSLRGMCLLVYARALVSLTDYQPDGSFSFAVYLTLFLLTIHALELVFAMKQVRLYKGPLWISVALTLLFGLLHWQPLIPKKTQD
jgi:uncharacterized protein YhhL (DUF1145 family)